MPHLDTQPLLWIGIAFVCSLLLTGLIKHWALRLQVMDTPNERSMHAAPIPRGGGLAFALLSTLCFAGLAWTEVLPARLAIGLGLASFAVALIGLIDDFGHVSKRLRLAVQLSGAAIGLFAIGALPELPLPTGIWQPSLLFLPLAAILLAWFTNLFNFMDGINGLAALEAITVFLAAAFLMLGQSPTAWTLTLFLLAAIVAGFVPWNFPRAKIFMGDCGSGFLGMLVGLVAFATATESLLSLWSWMILLGVFVVDTSFTLSVRFISGQAWNQAHRRHAYQIISQKTHKPTQVTLGVIAINLFWLFPLAKLAQNSSYGMFWLVLAYSPLVILCLWLGAGSLENTSESNTAKQM